MATDSWDADDFVPEEVKPVVASDRWEGEDEDDNIKDNWFDEEDENASQTKPGGENGSNEMKAVQVKKKVPLAVRIAQKEEQRLREKKEEEESKRKLTPAELAAEKEKLRKIQEEADLRIAMETMGVTNNDTKTGIDSMHPVSEKDFEEFETALKEKITTFENSDHYVNFLDRLFRDVSISCSPENLKKLSSTLSVMATEKSKAIKKPQAKKKSKKANLFVAKGDDHGYVPNDDYVEYEDFL